MYKYLERRLALSPKGAKNFVKAVFFTILLDFALLFPAIYFLVFLREYLEPVFNPDATISNGFAFYFLLGLGIMLLMWLISIVQYRNTFTTVYDESASRRILLAEKLRVLPLAFFGEKNLSDLTSTIMSDSTDLETTFSHSIPQLLASIISMVLISIGLFFYNWQLSLALFWVVPIAAMVIILSKKINLQNNATMYQTKRNVSEHIQEGLDNIQEIKSYNQEETYLKSLDKKLNLLEESQIKMELIAGTLVNSSQSLLKLGMVSVIILGAAMLISASIDIFTYLVFLLISTRIYVPINESLANLAVLYYLDIRINRLKEIENLPIQTGKKDFHPEHFDIEFKDVSFSYETGKQVLQRVTFTAKQGEITALVGPSGGGKSTSTKLAARFWDINSGKILLGNQDIQKIEPETLLKYYSVVFQEVVLFNSSVIDNIRIGKKDATDEEVYKVAKMAYCDAFIKKLPNGYNTVLGENGETLSGGERQRISIARALLKDAPIILLDEATASLDVENETKIQAAISTLIKDKTAIIIAHRMRTVANAHKIIVLENGKVVESGSPQNLIAQNGMFARMVERQMGNSTLQQ